MHRLGSGTTHDMTSVLSGIFWPSPRSPQYIGAEKIGLWRGKLSSGASVFWDEMLATDLGDRVTDLAIPAYFWVQNACQRERCDMHANVVGLA